jgi:hypothetical protein
MQSTVYGRVNSTRDVFITMARSRLAERLSEFIKEQRQYQSLTDETSPLHSYSRTDDSLRTEERTARALESGF